LFDISTVIGAQSATSRQAGTADVPDGSALLKQMRRVLGTYALSRRLERGGCMVWISGKSEKEHDPDMYVMMLNMTLRKHVWFGGVVASILATLIARLWNDLDSGLRSEQSGWMGVKGIHGHVFGRTPSAAREIRLVRRKVREAGLAVEMVQERDGEIRLNPDLVAIPSKLD
jgi:hypothetical protein